MTTNLDKAIKAWAKLLNPDVLRSNLIAASIFLAAYEMLLNSIIDQIRSFFSHEVKDGKWLVNADYATKCLALHDKPLRASLLWLKQMSAIDDAEILRVDRIREHRNELAHELPKFLATADAEVNIGLLTDIYELVAKIDRWWIREIDLDGNLGHNGRDIADEDITSGNMLFIQMIRWTATGEDARDFWEEFQKYTGSASTEDLGGAS